MMLQLLTQVRTLASYRSGVCEVNVWTALYGRLRRSQITSEHVRKVAVRGSRTSTRRRRSTTACRPSATRTACSTAHIQSNIDSARRQRAHDLTRGPAQ
jgi:hypothetical protein